MIKGRILKYFALLTVFFFVNAVIAGSGAGQPEGDILSKARILIKEGDFDGAVRELDDVIAKLASISSQEKRVAEAHYLLARIYKIVQMEDKYREHLKMAFKTFPKLDLPEPDPGTRDMVEKVKAELDQEKEKSIEKEKPDTRVSKKKKFPVLPVLAGAAVVIAGVLLFTGKKESGSGHYDTQVLGIQWIDIPAGEFRMGDNFDGGWTDEVPVHPVYLAAYKISRHEITYAQYDTFCSETGRNKPDDYGWGRDTRPVTDVSWEDAQAFCNWLSRVTGKNLHLPTEAQWEKAAKGPGDNPGKFPWGNTEPSCDLVNYNNCKGRTMPVGSYAQEVSPYGVKDMAGNVFEWCADWYDASYYAVSPRDNPAGPGSGLHRVSRGGAWNSTADHIRCSDRDGAVPSSASSRMGFRICWD